MEWMPIETAPKDGSDIMLFGSQMEHYAIFRQGSFPFMGYYDTFDKAWCATGSCWDGPFYEPTHWAAYPNEPDQTR